MSAEPIHVHPSPRRMLRQFVERYCEGRAEVSNREAIEAAYGALGSDPAFLASLAQYAIGEWLPDILRGYFSQQREMVTTISGAISRTALDEGVRAKLSRWYEAVEEGLRKPLLTMTQRELLAAATARETRARGEMRAAAFLRDLASHMPADTDGIVLGELLTDAQLAELYRLHFPNTTEGGD